MTAEEVIWVRSKGIDMEETGGIQESLEESEGGIARRVAEGIK